MVDKQITRIQGKRLTLEFATVYDKKVIYDFLISPEIIQLMFDETHQAPTWDEFSQESDDLYAGYPNEYGSYLLIKVDDSVIGSISFTLLRGIEKCAELDIWISSFHHIGKGYGTEALNLIIHFVKSQYDIHTFMIRPWIKNINAIKAYKKCGFKEIINFNPAAFYSHEEVEKYGDGDYGINETINMIYRINEIGNSDKILT